MHTRVEIALSTAGLPEADGLLLPTNDYLWMAAGPALELKTQAGEEVEIEAVRQGPIALGEVVATAAGSLALSGILHAAVMGQDLHLQEEAAAQAIRKGLAAAGKRKWSRLLVHSFLATGRGTHREVAARVLGALVDELLEGGSLREVTLLASDEAEHGLLHDAMLRIIQGHE
jgi:O-acetyl-ADP-ribose deacetylase (regulator of RNase III)